MSVCGSVSEREVLSRSEFDIVLERVGVFGNVAVCGKWRECVGECSSVFNFGQTFGHTSHVIFQFQHPRLKNGVLLNFHSYNFF